MRKTCLKPAGSRSRAFRLRVRPDIAARVVGSFPWDTRWHEHVAERLAREMVIFG